MCGEKTGVSLSDTATWGSPPRVRGKDLEFFRDIKVVRITPACAGKRSYKRLCSAPLGDHPRVCGEKASAAVNRKQITGSPPRVRGKERCPCKSMCRQRITPACAGKSTQRNQVTSHQKDHPRVCGEKTGTLFLLLHLKGSPPRVRGKATLYPSFHFSSRITPACAGKRYATFHRFYRGGDHPRVCGEKTKKSP